ncbi:hypothetical protein KCTC32516_00463 [Polaribacter huanghezhanensis]|uniref:hypothetical protein n=1 Tax=Polaribacter huanghezhanensis TaxID=1354726 RepID=UPI002647C315|nr:hypothetical protein [Polaribacter huanghezhanensis]WKD85124.1 hypothetical protein KCTC32516_00463 [Polaribacter huanghezhanensis]
MNKIITTIRENWKDPVWSKVIAAAIIGISGFLLTTIVAVIRVIFNKIPFSETFNNIWEYLNNSISISILYVIVIVVLYLILTLKHFITFINDLIKKIQNISPEKTKKKEPQLQTIHEHSTVLFSDRMAAAFPGIRDITWFNNPVKAVDRLDILLKQPLRFKSQSSESDSDPIWWWRGGSALFIEKFKRIGKKRVLMGIKQLKIKRIAAYHGDSYYKDFVYVEVEGEKSTGLYNYTKEDIQRHVESIGFSCEEYGVIKNWFGWSTPITREEYDDGAAVIRGRVKDMMEAKLRLRYLTKFNFIIAAKGSPYNSRKFCLHSKRYFDGILKNDIEPNEFFAFLKDFNKNER